MINLSFFFEDAVDSLKNGADVLQIKSLPVTILMMQKDVLNHYKYAIEHYFHLTLNENFLQNSSLGTPYQKWRKFTNDDFNLLFYSIKTLITFSSRLFHESEFRNRIENREFDSLKMDSNRYTDVICDFKYKNAKLGVVINDNESLDIYEYVPERVFLEDRWHSTKITNVDISCRKVISEIISNALKEITLLEELHAQYVLECQSFVKKYDIFQNHENVHQSYWV